MKSSIPQPRLAALALGLLGLVVLLGAPAAAEEPARATTSEGPAAGASRTAAPLPTLPGTHRLSIPEHLQRRTPAAGSPKPRPVLQQCEGALPPPGDYRPPFGERLGFDLEVMGVRAGRLDLRWSPDTAGAARIDVLAQTNTFFENVRKLRGEGTSYLTLEDLRPTRYREDAVEDAVAKWADVLFRKDRGEAQIHYAYGAKERRLAFPMSTGPHDILSAIFYLRTLDLAIGQSFCLDVYGNRRIWRMKGAVETEEWVSTPVGKFKTWRLSGVAQRIDMPSSTKEIHLWIAQDEHRTPVAVLGEIDLGAVTATLSSVKRPGEPELKPEARTGGTW
ncbi:MAG: DUF3108 domain-containing protein [Deltaproteobacteria bacterium]|nr:DUF3108 domain-containing protein [Deltaproteobacteria bacterium]